MICPSPSTRPCLPVSGCVAGTQLTWFWQSQAAVCTQRRFTTNLPTSAFRSRHAASAWPPLVKSAGESRLQAGRGCLSVPTWHGTAVSVRRPATCRRTESAPAAFFSIQHPCRPINQTRTVGDRAFPVAGSRTWNSLPTDVTSATTLAVFCSRLKQTYFLFLFLRDHVVLTLTVLSAFAVCINLGHLKDFSV